MKEEEPGLYFIETFIKLFSVNIYEIFTAGIESHTGYNRSNL